MLTHAETRPAAPVSRSAAERPRPAQRVARPPPFSAGRPALLPLQSRAAPSRPLRPPPAASFRAPVQRTIHDDANAIRQKRAATTDPVLRKILTEVIQTYDARNVTARWGPSAQTSHLAPSGPRHRRRYEAVIDPAHYPDNPIRQSILAHELIHAASDTRYAANQLPGNSALNLLYDRRRDADEQHKRQIALRAEVVDRLMEQVEADRATLGDTLANHLADRLTRAGGTPSQEFDTVLTELFYYLSKAHPGHAGTGTFAAIRHGADAAYEARNNQVPMATSYAAELPALRLQRERREAKNYVASNHHLKPEPGAEAAFAARRARASTDLDAATTSRALRTVFEQAWRDLVHLNLVRLGATATALATAQSLDTRSHTTAGIAVIQDTYAVKAWIAEGKKKYASYWWGGWSLNRAITSLEAVVTKLSALYRAEETGVRFLDTLVPFE